MSMLVICPTNTIHFTCTGHTGLIYKWHKLMLLLWFHLSQLICSSSGFGSSGKDILRESTKDFKEGTFAVVTKWELSSFNYSWWNCTKKQKHFGEHKQTEQFWIFLWFMTIETTGWYSLNTSRSWTCYEIWCCPTEVKVLHHWLQRQ